MTQALHIPYTETRTRTIAQRKKGDGSLVFIGLALLLPGVALAARPDYVGIAA
jgi:hypothetical protein